MPRQADHDSSVMGSTRTLLWIASGSGLHEMEMCDPSIAPNWQKLPERVLSNFPAHILKASVLWHTVGGGFTKRHLKRYQGVCANVTARTVADLEISRLRRMGVAYTDFAEVAETFAPLMFDGIHFTSWYDGVSCSSTFPELAGLTAVLALQRAVQRPLDLCRSPIPHHNIIHSPERRDPHGAGLP
mmetsp:Transcript_5896/g.12979  ORF Transcript_5896/g.12979 Transcript_5896/m.12979 type:complete len:186 (-) Transcript_5896:325-882(-)